MEELGEGDQRYSFQLQDKKVLVVEGTAWRVYMSYTALHHWKLLQPFLLSGLPDIHFSLSWDKPTSWDFILESENNIVFLYGNQKTCLLAFGRNCSNYRQFLVSLKVYFGSSHPPPPPHTPTLVMHSAQSVCYWAFVGLAQWTVVFSAPPGPHLCPFTLFFLYKNLCCLLAGHLVNCLLPEAWLPFLIRVASLKCMVILLPVTIISMGEAYSIRLGFTYDYIS